MNPLMAKNLRAISRHPRLVKILEQFQNLPDAAEYLLEDSRNGQKSLQVKEKGKAITYHSRYDPLQEARKQVAGLNPDVSHILVLGFGLGYQLEAILEALPAGSRQTTILVVEPDPKVMLLGLGSRSLVRVLADPRVQWCVAQTPDEIGDLWSTYLEWSTMEQLCIIEHPPSLTRFRSYFERLKEKLRYLSNRSKGNLVTLMNAGFEFHTNNFLNFGASTRLPGISRLFNRFTGLPAIIVAAGPSLEKNVHLLAEVKDRFLIIAVDTAFRQLAVRGLKPDIVCAADPSYLNSLDFVGVEDVEDVILAVEPMVHPDIIESFQGPKMMMAFGGGIIPWVEKFREPFGNVICWGSIATTAFDMARQLGCDPIVFLGLDLSFADGRLYARGSYSDDILYDKVHHLSSLEHEIADYIAVRGVHRLVGPRGDVVFTDQNMNMYRQWFEDQFRSTKARVINATEGGVVTRHVQCQTLAETIQEYRSRGGPIRQILSQAFEAPLKVNRDGLQEELRHTLRELTSFRDVARDGLGLCRKLEREAAASRTDLLSGEVRVWFDDVCRMHDKLCSGSTLLNWFTIYQTKLVTRHTMQVRLLSQNPEATTGEWVVELQDFFQAILRFHEYQLPLLQTALQEMRTMIDKEAGKTTAISSGVRV